MLAATRLLSRASIRSSIALHLPSPSPSSTAASTILLPHRHLLISHHPLHSHQLASSSFSTTTSTSNTDTPPPPNELLTDLCQRFDFTDAEVDRILVHHHWNKPQPQNAEEVINSVTPILGFLKNRLSLEHDDVRAMILRQSAFLNVNVDDLEPKLTFLEKRLDLNHYELRKIALTSPVILGLSVDTQLEPTLAYLETKLSLNQDELRRVIVRIPSTFAYDVTTNLDPRISFFETILGPSTAKRVLLNNARLIDTNLSNRLEPRRERMKEEGIEFNESTVKAMCTKNNHQFDDWVVDYVRNTSNVVNVGENNGVRKRYATKKKGRNWNSF
jgi:hypothetical protein